MRELSPAAGLLDVARLLLGDVLGNRLAVRDLRSSDVGADVEFPDQPVHENLEVQLSHAGDDRLTRFVVGVDAERRIFLRQSLQRDGQFLGVGLRLGLDGHVDHRGREVHLFQ